MNRYLGGKKKKVVPKKRRIFQKHIDAVGDALFADLGLGAGLPVYVPGRSSADKEPGAYLGPIEAFPGPSPSPSPGITTPDISPLPPLPVVSSGAAGLGTEGSGTAGSGTAGSGVPSQPPLPSGLFGVAGSSALSPPPGSADSMFSFNFDDVPSASGPGVLPGSDSDELLLNSIGDIELVQDEASQKAAAAEIRRKYDKAVSDLVDERGFTRAAALLDAFQREIEEIEDRGGKVPWRDFLGRIPIGWTPKEHEWMRKILQKEQNCSYARKSNRLDERENALKTEAGRRLSRAVWEMTKDGEAVTLTKEDVCVLRGYAAGWDDAMRQCRPRKVRKPPSTDTSMAGQYMKMRYKSSRKDKE